MINRDIFDRDSDLKKSCCDREHKKQLVVTLKTESPVVTEKRENVFSHRHKRCGCDGETEMECD